MTNEEAIAIITEAIEDYVCNHVTDTAQAQRMLNAVQALEQEPRYCDRNICLKNEYINIGCDECEVTKSQEPTDENLHREREQAYMQGYEDASKRFRQEPSDDAISRQWLMRKATEKFYTTNYFNHITKMIEEAPSVKPQEPTGHWVKTPKAVMGEGYMWYCDKCEHQVYQDSSRSYPSEKYCPNCGARMVEPQERSEE